MKIQSFIVKNMSSAGPSASVWFQSGLLHPSVNTAIIPRFTHQTTQEMETQHTGPLSHTLILLCLLKEVVFFVPGVREDGRAAAL